MPKRSPKPKKPPKARVVTVPSRCPHGKEPSYAHMERIAAGEAGEPAAWRTVVRYRCRLLCHEVHEDKPGVRWPDEVCTEAGTRVPWREG